MGYCLLNEAVLQSVLSIRDRFLKQGGIMIPRRVQMFTAAFEEILVLDEPNLVAFQGAVHLEAIIGICSEA